VPRLCHRWPSFRHVFTRLGWPARPERLPPIRRSTRAACRLPTSTAEMIYEHAFEPPRPQRWLRRRAAARRVVIPLRGPPAELSQARGCRGCPRFTPRRSDRSPQQIYPDLLDPDTSCRKLVPDGAWKSAPSGDRAVTWSRLRTNSPDSPCRSSVRLEGPPSTPTRESDCFGLRPRCLPPLSLSICSTGSRVVVRLLGAAPTTRRLFNPPPGPP
jgi:hypothetical protein